MLTSEPPVFTIDHTAAVPVAYDASGALVLPDDATPGQPFRRPGCVSERKADRLEIPWMALLAEDVMERPYWWVAAQDGLRPFRCPACSRRDARRSGELNAVTARARLLAAQEGWPLPPSPPYRFVSHHCWRCSSAMVVFLWPGGGGHSRQRPPEPIPASLRHRVTDGWGDYWANCCPRCSAVQGDYYLPRDNRDYAMVRELTRHEYDGPSLDERDDPSMEW